MTNPIDYFFDSTLQNLEGEDVFYKGLVDTHIYVEDYGKSGFYESVFKKIYPNKKLKVYANYKGKSDVVNYYYNNNPSQQFKNTTDEKYYFLLDKDFNDKYPDRKIQGLCNRSFKEINTNDNFRVLKKYSIESYFLSLDLAIELVKCLSECDNNDLEKQEFKEKYTTFFKLVNTLSKWYLFSNFFDLSVKYEINRYIDLKNVKFKEDELKRFYIDLKSKWEKKDFPICNEITKEMKALDFNSTARIIFSKYKFENDFLGKNFLKSLKFLIGLNFKIMKVSDEKVLRLCNLGSSQEGLEELKTDLNFEI